MQGFDLMFVGLKSHPIFLGEKKFLHVVIIVIDYFIGNYIFWVDVLIRRETTVVAR